MQIGFAGTHVGFVVLGTVQQQDDVGVLLQGPGFAQIRHHGFLVGARFRAAVQLGNGDDRDLQLFGQQLQLSRHVGNELLARFLLGTRGPCGGLHQLQIVQHNQRQTVLMLEAPGLGADIRHRHIRRIIDENRRLGNPQRR